VYSGTTFTKVSGRILGAHQKIDRIARRHLRTLISANEDFPLIREILQFEGLNGPDGIKRKSPAKDEPWHFYNPADTSDTTLLELIADHYQQLVIALKDHNREHASFQAAWMAHAIVDGLTPAHHYPYDEKLSELRGGEGQESRTTIKAKLVMPGETRRAKVKNNWKMWGPKGLFTTHTMFEMGVATLIMPLTFSEVRPRLNDTTRAEQLGVVEYFKQAAQEVAALQLYEAYYRKGWTPRMALRIRQDLGPIMVRTVTLSWWLAAKEAGLNK
jgi:hypothetical protein